MAFYSSKLVEWSWTLDSTVEGVDGKVYQTTWIPKVHTKLLEPLFDIKYEAKFDGTKWKMPDGTEYAVSDADKGENWKPPCPVADAIVNAYNGNMIRESGINHYRNEVLVIANDLEADGRAYHADQLRKLVDVVKEMTEEAKPSEAALDRLVEAATGLD